MCIRDSHKGVKVLNFTVYIYQYPHQHAIFWVPYPTTTNLLVFRTVYLFLQQPCARPTFCRILETNYKAWVYQTFYMSYYRIYSKTFQIIGYFIKIWTVLVLSALVRVFQPLSTGISHGTSDQYFFFIELNRLNRATAVDTSRGDQCPASQGRGFNGATAFQPWILDYAAGSLRHDCLLQWSHGLSAVDTWLNRCLPFRISGCFNGATAFQPWIRDLCVMFYLSLIHI